MSRTTAPPDLSRFEELKGKKVAPELRFEMARQEFPSFVTLNWKQAFGEDIELFGRILRDIIKTEQSVPGRSGPRPPIDKAHGMMRLRQYMGVDYCELEFPEAFRLLTRDKSIRVIAEEVGIDRNMVRRLLANERPPDVWVMEQIATTYNKKPSFFMEYRVAYILGALGSKMSPELTIDLYRKLRNNRNGDH